MADRVGLKRHVVERTAQARIASRTGEVATAWAALEDAHVLSQPLAVMHVRVHLAMLALGVRTRDRREITGQAVRLIVAAPGSWLRRYPLGNTGRSDVPATRPMPIRPDLQEILDAAAVSPPS